MLSVLIALKNAITSFNLTDLVENIEWVFNNPEKAEEIAISAKKEFFRLTTREYQDKVIKDALEIQ